MKLQNVPDYQVLERVDAAILMEIGADDLNEVETGLRTKRVDTSVGLVEGRRHFVVVLACTSFLAPAFSENLPSAKIL